VISDELESRLIIDGNPPLQSATVFATNTTTFSDLEAHSARRKMPLQISCTDGCFSMDGTIANLSAMCDLAEKYNALTMIDDATPPFLREDRTVRTNIAA